jgi:hypothetical protein
MSFTKSPFNLRSYGAFVRSTNTNKDLLKGSWKDVLANAFELTPEQQAAIAGASEHDSQQVQEQFDAAFEHVSKGGKIRTRISTRSDGSHGLKMMLDEAVVDSSGHSLVCCGADCRDWGVWCADPPQ